MGDIAMDAESCRGALRASVTAPASVLLTAEPTTGVWTYAVELARGLVPLGVRCAVAVIGAEPTGAQLAQVRSITGLTVLATGLRGEGEMGSRQEAEEAGQALADIAARAQADLLQVNSPMLAATGSFPGPLVVACHWDIATWWRAVRGDAPPPPEVRWRTELTARALARADALLAPSAAFASIMAETHALAQLPRVARNGRTAPVRPAPESPPAEFVFTVARLWDEAKNVALLDRAAARVQPTVIAAGPVRGPRGMQATFGRLCTPGTLAAADVTALLAERPVFVSTSRYEPFGLPVLEAAQAGCALVLTSIPTFRELWGGAALFVDPDDDAALADAINGLFADPVERARLGAAAAERARRYTVPAMVQATLSAWGYPSGAVRAAMPAASGSAA